MDRRYTRLKLKMLLMTLAAAILAVAAGWLLTDLLVDGPLRKPFTQGFLWLTQTFLGRGEMEGLSLYQRLIVEHRGMVALLWTLLFMLGAFSGMVGLFARWIDRVGQAARRMVGESETEILLPRELAPVEKDLRALQTHLRQREAAARESEQRRGELVAFLAHDLKTPLTSVVGYLTLLEERKDLDSSERAKYTGIALEKAKRLEELLGEFFDITRMDLSDVGEGERIQLTVLLEQLADEFYPLFAEKELTCETEIQGNLAVFGEGDKLARVFDNVLRNAVSYSTPGGRVGIAARRAGEWVEVKVSNEGLEIPEGELSRIFQKFYRLDAARSSRTGGAGLGLAIAKEIVERHGGSIRAESTGKLTIFTITLPAYREQVPGPEKHRKTA